MTRPTLHALARQHAAERLTKKERNADLRRHHYNPDGADGVKYRRLLKAEMMAEFVADVADEKQDLYGPPDVVVLWIFPPEDHPRWIAHGMGDMPYQEYIERVRATKMHLQSDGHRVAICRATVAKVLEQLDKMGLDNTPENRAAAFAFLIEE